MRIFKSLIIVYAVTISAYNKKDCINLMVVTLT
jgi:hypothetical protein